MSDLNVLAYLFPGSYCIQLIPKHLNLLKSHAFKRQKSKVLPSPALGEDSRID